MTTTKATVRAAKAVEMLGYISLISGKLETCRHPVSERTKRRCPWLHAVTFPVLVIPLDPASLLALREKVALAIYSKVEPSWDALPQHIKDEMLPKADRVLTAIGIAPRRGVRRRNELRL